MKDFLKLCLITAEEGEKLYKYFYPQLRKSIHERMLYLLAQTTLGGLC